MAFSRRNKPYRIERNAKGELEILTPVGSKGSIWEARAIGKLAEWADEHGGVVFSSNAGFTLPDGSVRSPDAAWASNGRWDALRVEEQEGYAPMCPEFVIEVRSKSDSREALRQKMELWIASGSQLAWMVDPFARTVEVFQPGVVTELLEGAEAVIAQKVVPEFRLELTKLWDR